MSQPIDLNALVQQRGTITIAPPESPEDAKHRRKKDLILTGGALLFILGAVVTGLYFFVRGTDGQQRWAQAALTTVLGSAITYFVKK